MRVRVARAFLSRSAGTTATMPMPMLKVAKASSREIAPSCCRWVKSGGGSQAVRSSCGGEAAGEQAVEVAGESAAGDVGEAGGDLGGEKLADGVEVAAVRAHERGASLLAEGGDVLVDAISGLFE